MGIRAREIWVVEKHSTEGADAPELGSNSD